MIRSLSGEQLVQKSAEIAERFHEGQAHLFGSDTYFNMHLEPVANIVRRLGYGALYIAGAYLHDIKEDTTISDDELIAEGIPVGLVRSVNILGKKPGQSHEIYMEGILTDPVAIVDKFADSSFNYAWTLLNSPNVEDKKVQDRILQYSGNIALLRTHLPPVV